MTPETPPERRTPGPASAGRLIGQDRIDLSRPQRTRRPVAAPAEPADLAGPADADADRGVDFDRVGAR
ncbi:MAG: hypothetical protein ABIR68_16145 [Ilumatobacteraceae bacterium]